MAPRKRNKQDELNRTYRGADVGRVGSSLRQQGYSQSSKGDTYYTVGGVKYDAATGRPVKNQPAKPTQTALQRRSSNSGGTSRPMPSAVTSGSSSGGSSTPSASRPTSSSAKTKDYNAPGGTDKERGMAQWAMANPKLAQALAKRNAERGTSNSSNPLMADFKPGLKAKEDAPKSTPSSSSKAEYNVSKTEGERRLKGGVSSTPANSGTKASSQTKENFSSESITKSSVKSPDYSKSKTGNNTGTAYDSKTGSLNKPAETLAEKLRKRRMGM